MFRTYLSVTAVRHLIEMKTVSGQRLNLAVRRRSSMIPAPLLTAAPVRALIDEQISVKCDFLPPNFPVTVCAHMHSEDGDLWEAHAHYKTNAIGSINLSSDHSSGGSYLGCEPMGLFWGLQPAPGGRDGLRLRKANVEKPYVVHISLLEGHISLSGGMINALAAVTTERWYMAPGVKRIEIRENGVVGTLFLPSGPGPFPGILDLWGMGGGLVEYRSALLASRGYAALSLAYIGHKDLPGPPNKLNVDDSYFKAAFRLLQDHCQIDADRIGVIGLSFGVFLTLRLAAQSDVNPSCLICINGPAGSTIPFPFKEGSGPIDSHRKYWSFDDQGYVIFREETTPANMDPKFIVKVEKISCPMMFIVGEDDLSAATSEHADLVEEKLRSAGKSHLFTRLSYPGAGHLIEPPYSPNVRSSFWTIKPEKIMTLWGGHLAPHAAAQEDSWKKMLDYLKAHLRQ